jgi:hypothetical protein
MSALAYRIDHGSTVIPVAQAPSVAELAQRARAHERITLTEAGADSVMVVSADDHVAVVEWETAFIAEAIVTNTAQRGPYLPNDLMTAVDAAPPAAAEAFLTALEARAGEDISADQLRALWERTTSG